ncbi:hypothetical protein RA210_U330015 [Rubrivivax sp. A210]|nr:hypothetical protein RA210_U330015 [Rubrivivax sp. A210]
MRILSSLAMSLKIGHSISNGGITNVRCKSDIAKEHGQVVRGAIASRLYRCQVDCAIRILDCVTTHRKQ